MRSSCRYALARVCGEPNLPVPLAHPLHVRPLKAAGAVAARWPAESVCSFDRLGLTVHEDLVACSHNRSTPEIQHLVVSVLQSVRLDAQKVHVEWYHKLA